MSHLPKVLNALSKLLTYPDDRAVQTAEFLFVVLQSELPAAARDAAKFGGFAENCELSTLEEAFTGTFDVNPACALEVGWHLFGEEYARGLFLVRMREELRKYGLAESSELPDHVSHVLAIVNSMPADEATRFVRVCVQPAVEKMNQALLGKETPYAGIVSCLALVLRHAWGEPEAEDASSDRSSVGRSGADRPSAFAGDPLRDYPVAGVMAGGASSCGEPLDLVPLTLAASLRSRGRSRESVSADGPPGVAPTATEVDSRPALPIHPDSAARRPS